MLRVLALFAIAAVARADPEVCAKHGMPPAAEAGKVALGGLCMPVTCPSSDCWELTCEVPAELKCAYAGAGHLQTYCHGQDAWVAPFGETYKTDTFRNTLEYGSGKTLNERPSSTGQNVPGVCMQKEGADVCLPAGASIDVKPVVAMRNRFFAAQWDLAGTRLKHFAKLYFEEWQRSIANKPGPLCQKLKDALTASTDDFAANRLQPEDLRLAQIQGVCTPVFAQFEERVKELGGDRERLSYEEVKEALDTMADDIRVEAAPETTEEEVLKNTEVKCCGGGEFNRETGACATGRFFYEESDVSHDAEPLTQDALDGSMVDLSLW